MKNTQKGSILVWFAVVVILLVGVGYILYSKYGSNCTIGGVTYTGDACNNFPKNTEIPTDLNSQIQQEMSKIRKVSPSGYFVPASIPEGYKPSSPISSFEIDSAMYDYENSDGKLLSYREYANSYEQNMTAMSSNKDYKIVKTFTYNGVEGKIVQANVKLSGGPSSVQYLVYNHGGNYLTIQSNDEKISPDILISLLKAMTVAK